MSLTFRRFAKLSSLISAAKGRLLGAIKLTDPTNNGSLYLHGKTLVFTLPSATVTFAASPAGTQVPLTLQQIKTQIEAQATGVSVAWNEGRIELYITAGGDITVAQNGTANTLLGFATTEGSTERFYNVPGGPPPALISIIGDGGSNSFCMVTDE